MLWLPQVLPANEKLKLKKLNAYTWSGVNRKGAKVSGEYQAESISQVKGDLRRQGITVTKIRKKTESFLSKMGNKIQPMDIAVVSRQIATMLQAGVPLVQSFNIISKSVEKPAMRELIAEIAAEVESGTALSETLRKHPLYFDQLYCDLIEAGEQSGALETIYDRVAIYKEKAEALKSKIKKAMFYPVSVIIVAIIVTTILLLFVIPQFEEIFAGFGAELPAFTQFVIGISRFLQDYWPYIFGGIFALGFGYVKAHRRSQAVKDATDRFILRIPVINPILHKAAMARFARTLSTTFAAGIPLIDALRSASGASGNVVYRNAVDAIRIEVTGGMQMNVAMRTVDLFPDMVTQMVMIGEESGSLDSMLDKVANIYEQQVDDAVDGLTSLIEPLIMAVLGVLVGGMVIAMYLPIFKLGSVVS
ncbi:type IV fimbrial assembly protein PilC [Agarivorans albus MKT 106]|uniref:Type IV fimbrial assembly protein PilC n=1 Tax=Agarivorans albus MKT 106 TaxID=1331007 RepID=R9PI40_AGAAL|nr:type II secretion system F family protein [Agarivorans albus]GAD01030.1 type IV fimbrial assembly protein PilC [Agarivorans albus MKT 106]